MADLSHTAIHLEHTVVYQVGNYPVELKIISMQIFQDNEKKERTAKVPKTYLAELQTYSGEEQSRLFQLSPKIYPQLK